jgi:transposase
MDAVSQGIAGIDVHKKMLAVVIGQPAGGATAHIQRKFGTTQSEIGHLAAWLQEHGVSEVGMESTAQYWRPVWYGLEAHFQLHLTHPLKTRAPRGRKSDFRDAQRLADRWHSGDLEESFIRNQVEGILEQGGSSWPQWLATCSG